MPTFCRHNRLVQNCAICSREQSVAMRPIVTSSAPKVSEPRPRRAASAPSGGGVVAPRSVRSGRGGSGMTVRKLARGAEDGYACELVPGLRSSADAERLAEELAFAAHRLGVLSADPPGLFAQVPSGDAEEGAWLAFLCAYIGVGEGDDPFGAISAIASPWSSTVPLSLEGVAPGSRSALRPARWPATEAAYRAWAARAGSQAAAFTGEAAWTPERRFARTFERLGSLPGLTRDVRFELLTTLGALGVFPLSAGAVCFGGENETTIAGKRVFGIGDPLLLERRASDLATAAALPIAAFDLGLHSFGAGTRVHGGLAPDSGPDPDALDRVRVALEL